MLSQADQYLLDRIRAGDGEAWRQLVERLQGRLVAFARQRMRQRSDAEDLVQESFMSFLTALPRFRGQASLETFLFTILRHKIIDAHRGRAMNLTLLQDMYAPAEAGSRPADASEQLPSDDPTVSWYARRDEAREKQQAALADALVELTSSLQQSLNFRDLMVIEMLFYCHMRNKDIAKVVDLTEQHVAQIKHRAIKQIRTSIQQTLGETKLFDDEADIDSLFTETWETLRPSCPKRSTIGAYMLNTLDDDWRRYVDFHLNTLGCRPCLANLEDMQQQTDEGNAKAVRDRIMQSTVGFLKR